MNHLPEDLCHIIENCASNTLFDMIKNIRNIINCSKHSRAITYIINNFVSDREPNHLYFPLSYISIRDEIKELFNRNGFKTCTDMPNNVFYGIVFRENTLSGENINTYNFVYLRIEYS